MRFAGIAFSAALSSGIISSVGGHKPNEAKGPNENEEGVPRRRVDNRHSLRGLSAHEHDRSLFSPPAPGLCKDGDPPFTVGAVKFQCEEEFHAKGGRCGTPTPTAEERARWREEFLQWKEMKDKQKPNGGNNGSKRRLGGCAGCINWNTTIITVPVAFHIIHSNTTGREYTCEYDPQTGFTLPYSESNCDYVTKSIQVMNDAFRGRTPSSSEYSDNDAKIQFCLSRTNSTDDPTWYNNEDVLTMKRELDVGGMETLNVFVNQPSGGILGYAPYPGNEDNDGDGVVILNSVMPDGGLNNYEEGDTLTHEVGHWLNLQHTHDGGCSGPGDYMENVGLDSSREKYESFGCPVGKNDCLDDGGPNPIHNFMSYVRDSCMDEFSPGQVPVLQQAWEDYRHKLGFSENVGLSTDEITCTMCGDDTAEGTEECDGTDLNGATCASLNQGFDGGTLACSGCSYDTSGCTTCGDNTAEGTEECDGTDIKNETCASLNLGFSDGNLACSGCSYDTSACTIRKWSCSKNAEDGVCEDESYSSFADCETIGEGNSCGNGQKKCHKYDCLVAAPGTTTVVPGTTATTTTTVAPGTTTAGVTTIAGVIQCDSSTCTDCETKPDCDAAGAGCKWKGRCTVNN